MNFRQTTVYNYSIIFFWEFGNVVDGIVLKIDFNCADTTFATDYYVLFEGEDFVDLLSKFVIVESFECF